MSNEMAEESDPRADLRWPTIGAVLAEAVEEEGDREALVDDGVSWSWRQLGDAGDRAAAAFMAAGVEVGHHNDGARRR